MHPLGLFKCTPALSNLLALSALAQFLFSVMMSCFFFLLPELLETNFNTVSITVTHFLNSILCIFPVLFRMSEYLQTCLPIYTSDSPLASSCTSVYTTGLL